MQTAQRINDDEAPAPAPVAKLDPNSDLDSATTESDNDSAAATVG